MYVSPSQCCPTLWCFVRRIYIYIYISSSIASYQCMYVYVYILQHIYIYTYHFCHGGQPGPKQRSHLYKIKVFLINKSFVCLVYSNGLH